MAEPRIPGNRDTELELPCGESVAAEAFDMGMREYDCACGETHAVVMDVHPLSRWIPEDTVEILRETIETTDEFESFGTIHLMGIVLEEFPSQVASLDCTENERVGWALLWVTGFDARRLHEVVVELLVELMEHAMSHADDEGGKAAFEEELFAFDVEEFVEEYRRLREFDDEFDVPA